MKKLAIILFLAAASAAYAGDNPYLDNLPMSQKLNRFDKDSTSTYKQGTYGPNTYSDNYGRARTPAPAYPENSLPANSTIQKYNAYGPGIHMDQYGNAVTME